MEERHAHSRYRRPTIETFEAGELIRALGPAQGMSSGVLDPTGPPWGPGGKKGHGGGGD